MFSNCCLAGIVVAVKLTSLTPVCRRDVVVFVVVVVVLPLTIALAVVVVAVVVAAVVVADGGAAVVVFPFWSLVFSRIRDPNHWTGKHHS